MGAVTLRDGAVEATPAVMCAVAHLRAGHNTAPLPPLSFAVGKPKLTTPQDGATAPSDCSGGLRAAARLAQAHSDSPVQMGPVTGVAARVFGPCDQWGTQATTQHAPPAVHPCSCHLLCRQRRKRLWHMHRGVEVGHKGEPLAFCPAAVLAGSWRPLHQAAPPAPRNPHPGFLLDGRQHQQPPAALHPVPGWQDDGQGKRKEGDAMRLNEAPAEG